MDLQGRSDIKDESLYDLLRYPFLLEYSKEDKIWFDLHPCCKEAIDKIKQ
jgi:hypothetical protein